MYIYAFLLRTQLITLKRGIDGGLETIAASIGVEARIHGCRVPVNGRASCGLEVLYGHGQFGEGHGFRVNRCPAATK